mgnify:FL=1|tara:strand:+ start:15 stop:488 length:474 start_codon:yes stop_codon:yes gene_type:complete
MKDKQEEIQTIKEALTKFQEMNVKATKESINPHFKSKYSDLTSVINAVNHGAEFGLSFTQSIDYKNVITKKEQIKYTKEGEQEKRQGEDVVKDIFVTTTIRHNIDDKEFTCCVPVLVKGDDKDNPQKMGSAITYAKRYGLQSLYGLASDDDDGNLAS